MYNASPEFKTGIYATSRMNKGRVTFDVSDVTAADDMSSVVVTSESTLSDKYQLNDKVRGSSYKFATLETDRFALDGSWTFADDNLSNNGEIGWASEEICDASGVFASPQQLTFVFNSDHSSLGLTISFDTMTGEYATDFTMIAYDASDNILITHTFTDNDLVQVAAQGQLNDYRKVAISISKWSVPNRRARVAEVDFGVVKVYTGELGLINMQLTEEMDLTSGDLPSPEFEFTIDNSSREFNILNPTGFYKSLQQKQQVIAEIGLSFDNGSIEWIPVGDYLLWEWQSDEGSLTSTFYARTKIDLMANVSYENETAVTKTLYQLAVDIFALCGITNYDIDTSLQSITTSSLVKKTNCKAVLQMIAIAGCANIIVTRENVIKLRAVPTLSTAVDTISMNDQYAEPRITLDKAVKQVDVSYFTDVNTGVVVSVTDPEITLGDTFKLENTLINSSARASAVGTWLLAQKNYRSIYTANWRGNQAQELGDVVAIGNSYGSDKNAYITRTELTYQGYVQSTTEARGVAN
jgi:hypothetical protein